MVKIIRHKINNYLDIRQNDMIEIDVRDYEGIPCIGHEPIKSNDDPLTLLWFLEECRNKNVQLIAVNIKSDGNESLIYNLLNESGINFFLFDMSRPSYHRYSQHTNKIALPVSEYDTVIGLTHFKPTEWVWLDCFNGNIEKQIEQYEKIDENKKVIFVSPDLHGRKEQNKKLYEFIKEWDNVYICTDYPEDYE